MTAIRDAAHAETFVAALRSALVMDSTSSRFSDGDQPGGLGAEIGISTTCLHSYCLHSYGPIGLETLILERFVVRGEGQVRM